MSKSLTYVEIDIPAFTQNSPPDSPPILATYRFAIDASYLPLDIDCIPNIKEVSITPAIISLGENLGQRASVEVTFKDHRHIFNGEDFNSGTFWGKFRARYGLKLTGYDLRIIRGYVGNELENMETRHFVIDSTDGPNAKGEYKIIAKDVLKLADGDKAQAPVLSNGFLLASLNTGVGSLTLSPSGVGSEYPASGYVNIGGKEIVSFTRTGDSMSITRAQFNTVASAHDAQERVQLCLQYTTDDVADIISDLLINYADIDSAWIPLTSWQAETAAYLGTAYSALIAEPTSVSALISELIQQAGLAIWWNEISEQINLQVLRPVASDADIYDFDKYVMNSFEVKEQPDKRLSQVYTYFGKINPLVNDDQINNYQTTAYTTNAEAEADYGGVPAIKKIFSRWIPLGGRSIANTLNQILLSRFRDPPRRFIFNIMRDAGINPMLGVGYQIRGWPLQTETGDIDTIPAQITRLNPRADVFECEAEEISTESFAGASSPDVHVVIIDVDLFNVNLRSLHDSVYNAATSGQTVQCIVAEGISVKSSSISLPAMNIGTFAAGVTVQLIVYGRIQGAGGAGGYGRHTNLFAGTGTPGSAGGPALYTRQAITLIDASGEIWGGGGGGGGGSFPSSTGCGGGGAGNNPGPHGGGDATTVHGADGTPNAGGAGGVSASGHNGGSGGNPGLPGSASVDGLGGGAAGNAIDGISFVTTSGSPGDRRGPQVN